MQVKKQQLEPDMEQWADSKLGYAWRREVRASRSEHSSECVLCCFCVYVCVHAYLIFVCATVCVLVSVYLCIGVCLMSVCV